MGTTLNEVFTVAGQPRGSMRIQRPATRANQELPSEIYISLVGSLFTDPRTLLVGAIGTIGAAVITALKSGERLLWVCALAMAVTACVRATDMFIFGQQGQLNNDVKVVRKWELRYITGSCFYVTLLGAWCLIAFVKSSDPEVQLLSFSLTLANMIGVAGRNFGSNFLVNAQLLGMGLPLLLALLMTGRPYYAIYACILFPFFLSFKGISDRLRQIFLDAVIATCDARLLAARLDTALNNMSHGLCMLDSTRRMVVANARLPQVLRIDAASIRPSAPIQRVLRESVRAGIFSIADLRRISADVERRLSENIPAPVIVESRDGRALALTFRSMSAGGSVVLVDDVTEQRDVEARIEYLARYDALTGLPNRTFFRDEMNRVMKLMGRGTSCAILFIDLDHFKQVNDTLGHSAGDTLLRKVADRMRHIVRETDVISRLGGDEFAVLQTSLNSPEDASDLARRLVEEVSHPYDIDGTELVIGASIGVALAPRDGTQVDLLLKSADLALYRVKTDGRSGWRFFEPDMGEKVKARRRLELDLRSALANDAFELHYQPIIDLKTERTCACEALLRWPHAERGMISPAEFVPVAEEIGLIVEIGNYVLRKACLEAMAWPNDVCVAVNLSAIQFRRGNVVRAIRQAITSSGLAAHRLQVEITESALIQDTEATYATLAHLRNLGVTISLDDFGIGYSSLSYLHGFPFNKLKIDRSFVRGIETSERSRTLLSGVARLSAELGLSVVVEGVETEDQLRLIRNDVHIDEAQGFLFCTPIPATQIRDHLYDASLRAGRVA
jgi:diguanylate cyclase (GGDEF)-like protein